MAFKDNVKVFWNHHGNTVLTVASCLCSVAGVASGIHGDRKYHQKKAEIEAARLDAHMTSDEYDGPIELDRKEKILLYAKCQIPTIILEIGAVGCAIGAHMDAKASLAAATGLANSAGLALAAYKDEVAKQLTSGQVNKIDKAIAEQSYIKAQETKEYEKSRELCSTNGKLQTYIDEETGLPFTCTAEDLRVMQANINEEIHVREGGCYKIEWYRQIQSVDPTFNIPRDIMKYGYMEYWPCVPGQRWEVCTSAFENPDHTYSTVVCLPNTYIDGMGK